MSISIATAREIVEWYQWTYFGAMDGCGEEGWTHDPRLEKMAEKLYDERRETVYGQVCAKSLLEALDAGDLDCHDEDPLFDLVYGGIRALANTLEYTWTEEDNKAAKVEAEAEFDQMYETASMLGLMDRVERGQMCAKDSVLIGTVDAESYEHLYQQVLRVSKEIGEPFNGTLEDIIRASHYDPDSDTASVLTSLAAFTRKRKAA